MTRLQTGSDAHASQFVLNIKLIRIQWRCRHNLHFASFEVLDTHLKIVVARHKC